MKIMIAVVVIALTIVAATKMLNLSIEFQVFVRFSTTETEEGRISYDSSTAI